MPYLLPSNSSKSISVHIQDEETNNKDNKDCIKHAISLNDGYIETIKHGCYKNWYNSNDNKCVNEIKDLKGNEGLKSLFLKNVGIISKNKFDIGKIRIFPINFLKNETSEN